MLALLPSRCRVVTNAVGNHDAGSSRSMSAKLVRRFEVLFGKTNTVLRHGGVEFVVVNGIGLDANPRNPSMLKSRTRSFLASLPPKSSPRILLLHVPLFRENDLDCGVERARESGHVTYLSPEEKLKPFEDVLTEESSNLILQAGKMVFVGASWSEDIPLTSSFARLYFIGPHACAVYVFTKRNPTASCFWRFQYADCTRTKHVWCD